ncbi:MAG: tetratricopeptide repeat protein [Proteobacteria bacterium]|nr:tetratricopeptide repeat protein [Pseudomonadota bacterium]
MKRTNLIVVTVIFFILCGMAGCATNGLKKERADAHLDVGKAYIQARQYTFALKELLEAEKINPRDPEIHYCLGISYHGKGLTKEAIAEFEKVVDLKPNYSNAHNYLGTIYLSIGLVDKAIGEFNKALANVLYTTPEVALYNMGRAYSQKGDYRTALTKYNEAVIKKPNTIPIPLIEKDMGIVSFKLGDVDKAIRHFRKSLEIAPEYVEPHYWLGRCYVKKGNVDGAIEEFRAVVRIAPESEFGRKARESLEAIEG